MHCPGNLNLKYCFLPYSRKWGGPEGQPRCQDLCSSPSYHRQSADSVWAVTQTGASGVEHQRLLPQTTPSVPALWRGEKRSTPQHYACMDLKQSRDKTNQASVGLWTKSPELGLNCQLHVPAQPPGGDRGPRSQTLTEPFEITKRAIGWSRG